MLFIVQFKSPGGRLCKLTAIAPNFDECLKKISSLYGKNLISITYDARKNSEANTNAIS